MRGLKRVKHVQAKMGDLAKAVDELRQMRARRRLAQLGGIPKQFRFALRN